MRDPDPTDHKLIGLLRANARMPVVELARRLGVSRATVQNRMNRLERDGILLGYTVRLRPEAEQLPVRALISIAAVARHEAEVISGLSGLPSVVAIHHTTGRWDIIAEIRTDSLASFNRLVGEVRQLPGIRSTETNLLLDSQLRRQPVS